MLLRFRQNMFRAFDIDFPQAVPLAAKNRHNTGQVPKQNFFSFQAGKETFKITQRTKVPSANFKIKLIQAWRFIARQYQSTYRLTFLNQTPA